MPPTIHLIRHAEGVHNLSFDNHGLHDPGLTDRGREQAQELAVRLTRLQADGVVDIRLVLASALRRTLMTALAAFAPQLARKQPAAVHAWPAVQEVSDLPCDSGSSLPLVQEEFGSELVNYDLVESGWELKQGKYANTASAVTARALAAREWLKRQPYKDIAVLSHGCFLHFLTEDWEGSDSPQGKQCLAAERQNSKACIDRNQGTSWRRTELRSFTFSPNHEGEAVLVETSDSRERRGLVTAPPSAEEQKRLRQATLETWTEWGILQ
ncbi:hypothetical protein LLEC1_06882 [Akanthomyces lecanii]|uniref:Uncharacterized protein n=1 Tax=Cordyceps confragosa TaxID=2714763 RepID=A0A179IFH0_CORDF|nr:hypothetical protein LLEC1_06882 [Akanthomyces lecanii]